MRWNRPAVFAVPWACAALLTAVAPAAAALPDAATSVAPAAAVAADGSGDADEHGHGSGMDMDMDMTDDEMAGMDHDGETASTPPAHESHGEMGMTDEEMSDMDHDDGASHGEGGHGEGAEPTSRPRAGVVGGFVLVNGAVLGAAAVVRRRARDRSDHRPPSGPATPTQTTTA